MLKSDLKIKEAMLIYGVIFMRLIFLQLEDKDIK
jgi:hypothetical protein